MGSKSFSDHVAACRARAVEKFLYDYSVTRTEWETKEWHEWADVPVFAQMDLVPLGGGMRFPGHALEEITYRFQNRRTGVLFGINIEVAPQRYWTGSVKTRDGGDHNDAAREAIAGLLELAYLRAFAVSAIDG